MPVIRPLGRLGPLASLQDHLTDLLVKELLGERSRMGPVIFELPSEHPDKVDVIVVWEAWKSVPPETRGVIVRDAYARLAKVLETSFDSLGPVVGPETKQAPNPASVVAVCWEDLTQSDLLPYKIEPNITDQDDPDAEDARLLMVEIGAIWTPHGYQLRFPNEEMAVDALDRVRQEMPEIRWTLHDSSFGPILS